MIRDEKTCTVCGCVVSVLAFTRHSSSKACVAVERAEEMVKQGWAPCKSDSRVLESLGVRVQRLVTRDRYHNTREIPWAPAWAVQIAGLPYPTKRRKRSALKTAIANETLRDAALTALMLGSPEGAMAALGVPT
jgi:hypothetical protein